MWTSLAGVLTRTDPRSRVAESRVRFRTRDRTKTLHHQARDAITFSTWNRPRSACSHPRAAVRSIKSRSVHTWLRTYRKREITQAPVRITLIVIIRKTTAAYPRRGRSGIAAPPARPHLHSPTPFKGTGQPRLKGLATRESRRNFGFQNGRERFDHPKGNLGGDWPTPAEGGISAGSRQGCGKTLRIPIVTSNGDWFFVGRSSGGLSGSFILIVCINCAETEMTPEHSRHVFL